MRKVMWAAVVVGLLMAVIGPATADTPYPAEATCPVDGRKFSWTTTASHSTWGAQLDAMPIGSTIFPKTIPQCPDSGFPVYKEEFTDAEKASIRALVLTPEYAAVRDETSYYLLGFVLGRLEPADAMTSAWILMQAGWQAREDAPRYARYALEIVAAMDAALPAMREAEPASWWYLQIAVANVQRQAGDFDGATARLDSLTGGPPAGAQLEERIALTRELISGGSRAPAALPMRRGNPDED